jgi:hypothetical protein
LHPKSLKLTLTGRDCGQDERRLFAAFRTTACGIYKKLMQRVIKLQSAAESDTKESKGLVERDVVK